MQINQENFQQLLEFYRKKFQFLYLQHPCEVLPTKTMNKIINLIENIKKRNTVGGKKIILIMNKHKNIQLLF